MPAERAMRPRGSWGTQTHPSDTVSKDVLLKEMPTEQDGLNVNGVILHRSLYFLFPQKILTAEVGMIRTVMPKMPFACRKTRETLSEESPWGFPAPLGS